MAKQTNVSVGIRLAADGSQLIGQAQRSREEIRKLGNEFDTAGRGAKKFSSDTDLAGKSTETLNKGVSGLNKILGVLGVSLSVAGIKSLITSTTAAADAIAKMSTATGISTDDLQRLEFVSGQVGVEFGKMTKAVQDFQRRMITDENVKTFVEALDIRDLNTTDQLAAIADAFAGIPGQAERATAASRLFGEEAGPEMLKLLTVGSEGLRDISARADELGLVLDENLLRAAENFNDTWDEVNHALTATVRSAVMKAITDDAGDMNETFRDFADVLTDPKLRAGLEHLVTGLISIATWSAKIPGLVTQTAESVAAAIHGFAFDDIERQTQRLDLLEDKIEQARQKRDSWRGSIPGYSGTVDARITEWEEEAAVIRQNIEFFEELNATARKNTEATEEMSAAKADHSAVVLALFGETEKATAAQKKANKVNSDAQKEMDSLIREFGRLRDTLDPVQAETRKYTEAVELLDRAWAEGLISGEEHWDLLNRLATGSEEAAKKTVELAAESDPFADAWKRAIEDVDRAFMSLWQSAFQGFRSFADSLKNAFLNLLAEMAHAAITRPIMINLGMAGALGAPGAASAGGGLSIPTGGLGNLLGGGGIATTANQLIHGSATGPFQTATGMGAIGGTNLGFGLSGLAGGLIGAQFGGYGSIGGSLGSMAGYGLATGGTALGSSMAGLGALAGPLGAIGGALLGGLLGSLFGGGSRPHVRVGSSSNDRDFKGGKFSETPFGYFGITDRHKMKDVDLQEARDAVQMMDTAIAAVLNDAQIEAVTSALDDMPTRRMGKNLGKNLENLIRDRLIVIFDTIDDPLKGLALAHQDSIETMVQMFLSLRQIQSLTARNPVAQAAEDIEAVQTTVLEIYEQQTTAVHDLIASYDGSLEATLALGEAYELTQHMAYELAGALLMAGREVDALLGNLSRRIEEDLIRDPAALYEHRRGRVDDLTEALAGMTDPGQILATIRDIESLTGTLWGGLDASQQDEMGRGFLTFLDEINALAQQQLRDTLDSLDRSQMEMGASIDATLRQAAGSMGEAANTQLSAAGRMESAAGILERAVGQLERATAIIPERIVIEVRDGVAEVGG